MRQLTGPAPTCYMMCLLIGLLSASEGRGQQDPQFAARQEITKARMQARDTVEAMRGQDCKRSNPPAVGAAAGPWPSNTSSGGFAGPVQEGMFVRQHCVFWFAAPGSRWEDFRRITLLALSGSERPTCHCDYLRAYIDLAPSRK